VLQQDPPAITLDQGVTAVHATVVTMEPAPLARPSTTVPLGTARVRLLARPARIPLLACTHAPASPGTLEMGKRARLSTTAPERQEERMPALSMPSALQLVQGHIVVPATQITWEMGQYAPVSNILDPPFYFFFFFLSLFNPSYISYGRKQLHQWPKQLCDCGIGLQFHGVQYIHLRMQERIHRKRDYLHRFDCFLFFSSSCTYRPTIY